MALSNVNIVASRSTGVAVPVFDDFFGKRRNVSSSGAVDAGAIETIRPGYKYGNTVASIS